MLGFIFGTVCLIAFIAVWRRRWSRGWHGARFGRWRQAGRGRYFGLYRLFEELDTSPGQEKAIRSAVAELRGTLGGLRPGLNETKSSVATALANETFDGAGLESVIGARVAELSGVGSALAVAIGKVHDALDAEQRRRLARFIQALPHGHAF